jgi:hypothetical protein
MNGRNSTVKLLTVIILILIPSLYCGSQEALNPLQSVVDQEKWDHQEGVDEVDLSIYEDFKQDLLDNPVNLGEINPLDLLRLGILDRPEMDALYQYMLDYGPLLSVYELRMVEGITEEKIPELVRYIFVHQGNRSLPGLRGLFRFPKIEVLTTIKRVLQTKDGFRMDSTLEGRPSYYAGSPWQQKMKIKASFGKNIAFSLSMKNDPGDQDLRSIRKFRFRKNAYSLIFNNIGCIKKAVIGCFGVSFGQGLTLGCGSGISLGNELDFRMQSRGLYPIQSFSEENSMQGAAVYLKSGLSGVCGFYSNRGDHKDAGLYFSGSGERWKSGVSLLYHRQQVIQENNPKPYQYYIDSSDRILMGWDGALFLKYLNLFHEISLDSKGNTALLAGATFSPAPLVRGSVVLLNTPGRWNNPHASSGLVNGLGKDRSVFNANFQFLINKYVDVRISSEYNFNRWMQYSVSSPTEKNIYHIIMSLHPSKTSQIDLFYKIKKEYGDINTDEKMESVGQKIRKYIGVQCRISPLDVLSVKFSAKAVHNIQAGYPAHTGILIDQEIKAALLRNKLIISSHYALFDTDTYNERIYAWESDVYQGFSIPVYYGRGDRWALVMQYKVNRWMDTWLKYSVFTYPGRSSIGNGPDRIEGNRKSELILQLRLVIPAINRNS